jgi:hypothetical protein
VSLNDPLRAVYLFSRDGTKDYEAKSDHLPWYSVDWSAMDKVTYPKSEECVIDDYTVVEDSYNEPILIEEGKECKNFYSYGKSIFPSL